MDARTGFNLCYTSCGAGDRLTNVDVGEDVLIREGGGEEGGGEGEGGEEGDRAKRRAGQRISDGPRVCCDLGAIWNTSPPILHLSRVRTLHSRLFPCSLTLPYVS